MRGGNNPNEDYLIYFSFSPRSLMQYICEQRRACLASKHICTSYCSSFGLSKEGDLSLTSRLRKSSIASVSSWASRLESTISLMSNLVSWSNLCSQRTTSIRTFQSRERYSIPHIWKRAIPDICRTHISALNFGSCKVISYSYSLRLLEITVWWGQGQVILESAHPPSHGFKLLGILVHAYIYDPSHHSLSCPLLGRLLQDKLRKSSTRES